MARPKSEDKRKAILEAAVKEFAARGPDGAPTAEISRRAGIAEGTLFTYFKTKHDLANALYRQIRQELTDAALSDLPRKKKVRRRLQSVWKASVRWGLSNPERRLALTRLEDSDAIATASRQGDGQWSSQIQAMAEEAVEQGRTQESLSAEFIARVFESLMAATTRYAAARPDLAEATLSAGFKLFWAGIRRKKKSRTAK